MEPSASLYTTITLRLYDFVVLAVSNHLAWRCPTRAVHLPYFQKHIDNSSAHLDAGVGSGYYPAASVARLTKTKTVTLLDLNPDTLVYTTKRLRRAGYSGAIEQLEHNVFHPLPDGLHGKFDSVSLYYLFHCLPGALPKKAVDVFSVVAPALAPGGVVFGATILGLGVRHNWLGRCLMNLYNKKGVFGNTVDSEQGLREALQESFEEYEVLVVGVVALFSARKPKTVKL